MAIKITWKGPPLENAMHPPFSSHRERLCLGRDVNLQIALRSDLAGLESLANHMRAGLAVRDGAVVWPVTETVSIDQCQQHIQR